MDEGKSLDDAIDLEADDYVTKVTTFSSVAEARKGVKEKQKRAEQYLASCASTVPQHAARGLGLIWARGGNLTESNKRQQQGRVISLLDSDSDEEDTASSPRYEVVTELLEDSDDEVQIVAPPAGYVPPPRKRPAQPDVVASSRPANLGHSIASTANKRPAPLGPPASKTQHQAKQPQSKTSESTSKDDAEIDKILTMPNFIGEYRPSLAPGDAPSLAISIDDMNLLSEQELKAKETRERQELEMLLSAKRQTDEKPPAVRVLSAREQRDALRGAELNMKPRARRRLAQDIVGQRLAQQDLVCRRGIVGRKSHPKGTALTCLKPTKVSATPVWKDRDWSIAGEKPPPTDPRHSYAPRDFALKITPEPETQLNPIAEKVSAARFDGVSKKEKCAEHRFTKLPTESKHPWTGQSSTVAALTSNLEPATKRRVSSLTHNGQAVNSCYGTHVEEPPRAEIEPRAMATREPELNIDARLQRLQPAHTPRSRNEDIALLSREHIPQLSAQTSKKRCLDRLFPHEATSKQQPVKDGLAISLTPGGHDQNRSYERLTTNSTQTNQRMRHMDPADRNVSHRKTEHSFNDPVALGLKWKTPQSNQDQRDNLSDQAREINNFANDDAIEGETQPLAEGCVVDLAEKAKKRKILADTSNAPHPEGVFFRHFFQDDPVYDENVYAGAFYSTFYPGEDEEDPDLPDFLAPVDHLSEYKVNSKTHLPEWTFYVHGADDTKLYKFKTYAAPSLIKGADSGAFISFEGAFTLKDEIRWRNEALEELVVDNPNQMPAIRQAILPDGFPVQVTINGEGLYEPFELLPKVALTRQPLFARIPSGASGIFEKTTEEVRIVGDDRIHDVYRKYLKRLEKKRKNGGHHPFGYLGTNVLTDYEPDETVTSYPLTENCIDLGCYGPFLRRHWKTDDVFVLKSFLFAQVPNEWGFSAEKEIDGQVLAVDITEDCAGSPSGIARMHIPMYVNEVGYNPKLRQNVFSKCVDGTKTHYYYVLGKKPMRVGTSIELYTNYKSAYESVRERRGYGKRNLVNGLPSDEVVVARLERNFSDREDAENIIRLAAMNDAKEGTNDLSRLLEFAQYEWNLLYVKRPHGKYMQVVALRRLMWIAGIFNEALENQSTKGIDLVRLTYALEWTKEVTHDGSKLFCQFLESTTISQDTCDKVRFEFLEEVLYDVRDTMPLLMDENLYCPLSRDLIDNLCSLIAQTRLVQASSDDDNTEASLFDALVAEGSKAIKRAKKYKTRCNDRSIFSFLSREPQGSLLCGKTEDILGRVSATDAFYLQHTTASKGILACIAKLKQRRTEIDSHFIVSQTTCMAKMKDATQPKDPRLEALYSIPVDTSSQDIEVNVNWYVYWQVVWVLHCFGQRFVLEYSIENLSNRLDVDPTLSQFVVQRGVRHQAGINFDGFLRIEKTPSNKDQPKNQRKKLSPKAKKSSSPKPFRPAAKLIYEGQPTTTFPGVGDWPPGWKQKTFQRASGASKGSTDNYWFAPDGRKLRSHKEIQRYLAKLH